MNSIDEFHFRYYANRLLREGYISPQEYLALLSAHRLPCTEQAASTNPVSSQFSCPPTPGPL